MTDSERKPRPECACCGAYLAVDGFKGLLEGEDSKAANLKCGCRYCWHCSDNRGRHEGHDPNCKGPNYDEMEIES
jgi:hypothetical protein